MGKCKSNQKSKPQPSKAAPKHKKKKDDALKTPKCSVKSKIYYKAETSTTAKSRVKSSTTEAKVVKITSYFASTKEFVQVSS